LIWINIKIIKVVYPSIICCPVPGKKKFVDHNYFNYNIIFIDTLFVFYKFRISQAPSK
jgi:hypothetical protein